MAKVGDGGWVRGCWRVERRKWGTAKGVVLVEPTRCGALFCSSFALPSDGRELVARTEKSVQGSLGRASALRMFAFCSNECHSCTIAIRVKLAAFDGGDAMRYSSLEPIFFGTAPSLAKKHKYQRPHVRMSRAHTHTCTRIHHSGRGARLHSQ